MQQVAHIQAGHPQLNVVLVPSLHDTHHDNIFPQPAFPIVCCHIISMPPLTARQTGVNERLHCAENPCTLVVDGLRIGVCSADVLMDLTKAGAWRDVMRCDARH